jgi:hypothetical protein
MDNIQMVIDEIILYGSVESLNHPINLGKSGIGEEM